MQCATVRHCLHVVDAKRHYMCGQGGVQLGRGLVHRGDLGKEWVWSRQGVQGDWCAQGAWGVGQTAKSPHRVRCSRGVKLLLL